MPERGPTIRPLALLSRLVPESRRPDWLREWRAELAHDDGGPLRRSRRLLLAAEDALRLRARSARPRRPPLAALAQDCRYALKAVRSRPGYAAAAVFAFALAIGANTAIFSVVSGVLFHELPYRDADSVVTIWSDGSERGLGGLAGSPPADILDWRREVDSLESIAALRNTTKGFSELERPLSPLTHTVTGNYFRLLGVDAWLGRTFTPEDEDGRRVAIVSHGLWRDALGADPEIVGTDVILDDERWRIVGVLPPDFYSVHQLSTQPDLWIPRSLEAIGDSRTERSYAVYARLAPGATIDEVREEMTAIAARFRRDYHDSHAGWSVTVRSIHEFAVGAYESIFAFLALAVALVLGIACANVANLALAQASSRTREIALRAALGAPQGRIRRQLLCEGLVLGLLGGAVGVGLAAWSLPLLLRLIPGATGVAVSNAGAAVPFIDTVGIDLRVLGFTGLVAVLAGLASSVAPAHQVRDGMVDESLRGSGRSLAGGSGGGLRSGLVVLETALAMVLVASAGLLLSSFENREDTPIGYDAERVLSLRNSLRGQEFDSAEARIAWFAQARRELASLPGVESVAAASFAPPLIANATVAFRPPGEEPDSDRTVFTVARVVTPGYFETLGVPVLQGRPIDATDTADSRPVLVINEEFRRRFLQDSEPIGARFVPDLTGNARRVLRSETEYEVVGVVGNIRAAGPDPSPVPIVYAAYPQLPMPIMNILVRTRGEPEALARQAEATLWDLSRSINVYGVEPLDERLGNLMWQPRLALWLLALFGAIALLLGAAGIYAVLAYAVSERVHEVGVRLALGADRARVLRMVVGDGLRLAGGGIALGLIASVLVGRSISGMLYGVAPTDPLVLGTTAFLLGSVAVLACLLPALRATRVEPSSALRD